MKLKTVYIKNFRNLKNVSVPIDDTTVLIGQNNTGKTAFIEALKITLEEKKSRTPFSEYDYHVSPNETENNENIVIEMWFKEETEDEWPESILQELKEIINLNLDTNSLKSIGLRVVSNYNTETKQYSSDWYFVDELGESKTLLRRSYLYIFNNYVKLYYIDALRDSERSFSQNSKFWGGILKDLEIDEDLLEEIQKTIMEQNNKLLSSDPRIGEVLNIISNSQRIMGKKTGQEANVRPLPIVPWEMMSKSELLIKENEKSSTLPLSSQGQGIQSLSVLFLFQAYLDIFLKPNHEEYTEAILTIEEPEAHLHPHAIRALTNYLIKGDGQRIITTHSPYFIQNVNLENIRVFRRTRSQSKVLYLKRQFTAKIPFEEDLIKFVNGIKEYEYHESNEILILNGKMSSKNYESLLKFGGTDEVKNNIKDMYFQSQLYLLPDELEKISTFVNRMRGDIVFAKGWFLCEGQSDYEYYNFHSQLLNYPFDENGISIIDYQNNGSPSIFIKIAECFDIPWVFTFDNDDGGTKHKKSVEKIALIKDSIDDLMISLPNDYIDLEMFLLKSSYLQDVITILSEEGTSRDNLILLAENYITEEEDENEVERIKRSLYCDEADNTNVTIKIEKAGSITTTNKTDDGFDDLLIEILHSKLHTNKNGYIRKLIINLTKDKNYKKRIPNFVKEVISKMQEVMNNYENKL
jgi:putative ATP-dependent endonuclease of OLD family